ncbi:MAG: choice-of-anchor D domain-containing protein [Candidatus Acidiferrales bacterium]
MMKNISLALPVLALGFILAPIASAQTQSIYIAATAQGAGTGADCADALPYTFFNSSSNWAGSFTTGKISPGTTVPICGTITASAGASGFLAFQGSGTSGHPITLQFTAGAVLTAPYWGTNGAIYSNGNNYITVDGNNLGGTVTASANGTTNIYVHTCVWVTTGSNPLVNCTDEGGYNTYSIWINGGSNSTITGNAVNDAHWGLTFTFNSGTTSSNDQITYNTGFNLDHGVFTADNNSNATITGFVIDHNNITGGQNWDDISDQNHHDPIHISTNSTGTTMPAPQISNNTILTGASFQGIHANTAIYIAGGCSGCTNGSGITGANVFNNVIRSGFTGTIGSITCQPIYGTAAIAMYGLNGLAANNTIYGSSTSACSQGNSCIQYLGAGTIQQNNVCQGFSLFTINDGGSTLGFSNYNDVYGTGTTPFHAVSTYYALASWQACTSGCQTTAGAPDLNSTTANPLLNTSSVPPYQLTNSGSAAWQKGTNLTSLGVAALDIDANGVARPATGNWDMGAYESSASGAVTLTPTSYTFATTVVGQPSSDSPAVFTLANSSGSTVTSISISFTGANAGDFSQTTSCGSSLANGSFCLINVTFTPAAVGSRSATLSVSDSGAGSPQTSSLSGIAVPSVTNPSPANPVTFGVVVTDPSIPPPVKNEKHAQNLSPYNFDHVALVGFLRQDRPGNPAGASASQ